MNAKAARVLAGVGVLAVGAVLFVVLGNGGGKSDVTDAGKVATIVVEGGEPVGGVRQLTYDEGDRIRFEVKSDVSDEVHVHGYDLMKDVKAGGTVAFDFPARIEGVFEAELEDRKLQIIEFTVK